MILIVDFSITKILLFNNKQTKNSQSFKITLTIASIIHNGITLDNVSCSFSFERSFTSVRCNVEKIIKTGSNLTHDFCVEQTSKSGARLIEVPDAKI